MKTIGFDITDNNVGTYAREEKNYVKAAEEPKASVVWISFEGIEKDYRYYNSDFNLSVGDFVFVSGSLKGKRGLVTKVETCFKIDPEDYEKVIAKASLFDLKGHWEHKLNLMVSTGNDAPTPDEFRSYAKLVEDKKFAVGDGVSFDIGDAFEVDEKIAKRGIQYCNEGKVLYLDVRTGVGTAFVQGETCYEVNFIVEDGIVKEMYCDCPYGGPCKHLVAVSVTLNALCVDFGYNPDDGFTSISAGLFYSLLERRDSIDL